MIALTKPPEAVIPVDEEPLSIVFNPSNRMYVTDRGVLFPFLSYRFIFQNTMENQLSSIMYISKILEVMITIT